MTENILQVDWDLLEMEDFRLKSGAKAKKIQAKFPDKSDKYGNMMETPKDGSIVNAKYDGVLSNQHCFSVPSYKDYIRVDNKQSENKYLKNLNIGDRIDILISSVDHDNFMIHGSISEIYENMAHQSLKSLDENVMVIANIKTSTPAGYDVEIIHGGITLPGFMPNTLAGINKLYDPDSILGMALPVMIESFAKEEGTYIVSRRKYLRSLIPEAIKELEYENVYTGRVTGTTPFGVFVEFNECLTGMIHKANIHDDWRERINEIRPGTEIEFYIKEVIKDKIILTQILRETLWDTIKNGQVISGVVKDNKQFGTLVLLDDETIGLIHISEMEKIGKNLNPDDEVNVKVLAVDRTNRKIFLTLA
jgi:ribosomal protein S1